MATMVKSMALEGIEGFLVEIEAATIRGQQQMISVIGLDCFLKIGSSSNLRFLIAILFPFFPPVRRSTAD